ncbi:MAG: hypothetical protein IK132_02435, partial [Clostridia bacterium]|nr:hypothetical protein [Clostridia bacterium]
MSGSSGKIARDTPSAGASGASDGRGSGAFREESAKRMHVDIRMYRVIYDAIDEVEAAMKGMLS